MAIFGKRFSEDTVCFQSSGYDAYKRVIRIKINILFKWRPLISIRAFAVVAKLEGVKSQRWSQIPWELRLEQMAEGHLILLPVESLEMINPTGSGDSACDQSECRVQLYWASELSRGHSSRCWEAGSLWASVGQSLCHSAKAPWRKTAMETNSFLSFSSPSE